MKKLLLLPLIAFSLVSTAQITSIPDSNFEQRLIFLGYDNVIDGGVLTANISGVTSLTLSGQNISDLTGIEDFTALMTLFCNNNHLTNLDVTQNTTLGLLWCDNNQLTNLDVTQNTALDHLVCTNNNLICLNVANGNNTNSTDFYATGNVSLTCIEVDDVAYSTANWTDIDPHTSFSEDCNYPTSCGGATDSWDCVNNTCTDPGTGNGVYSTLAECQAACVSTTTFIKEIAKDKTLLNIYDLLGRPSLPVPNQILLYKYSDGSVEKRIQLDR